MECISMEAPKRINNNNKKERPHSNYNQNQMKLVQTLIRKVNLSTQQNEPEDKKSNNG